MSKIFQWVNAATMICGIVITMNSCSDDKEQVYESVSVDISKSHRLSAEQATQNALDFVGQYGATTRTENGSLKVAEVKAFSVDGAYTRSESSHVSLDSLFYVINFADNKGFVIASSDDRETPVFAYVDSGTFEENNTQNNGYDAFLGTLIEMEMAYRVAPIQRPFDEGEQAYHYKPDKFEVMYPLLKTKWDQETYNAYCPGLPTGCVPTAITQICSFLKKPNYISWSNNGVNDQCYIDWDNILNECTINDGEPKSEELKKQVAKLMRYWGVVFDAEYSSDATSVNSDNAISKMRELGYNATELTDYEATNVMNDLKKGDRIIFMRGNARYYHVFFVFRKYVDGHAWVVDGYINSCKKGKESLYLHCNWGWEGYHNGYFLSDVLDAGELPCYDDNAIALTRSDYNYRYNLETSTICK